MINKDCENEKKTARVEYEVEDQIMHELLIWFIGDLYYWSSVSLIGYLKFPE